MHHETFQVVDLELIVLLLTELKRRKPLGDTIDRLTFEALQGECARKLKRSLDLAPVLTRTSHIHD